MNLFQLFGTLPKFPRYTQLHHDAIEYRTLTPWLNASSDMASDSSPANTPSAPSSPDDGISSPIGNTFSSPINATNDCRKRGRRSATYETPPPPSHSCFAATPDATPTPNLKTSTSMRNLNPSNIEKMVSLKGMIIRCSSIIPEIREAVFRCLVCGHFSDPIVVGRGQISEPTMCKKDECKTKNSMTLVHN